MIDHIRWPKRPDTFDDALNYYLFLCGYENLVPDEVKDAIRDANPHGWGTGPEDKKAMHDLMLAFAVRERRS